MYILFQGSFIFGRTNSSHLFRITTSTHQLFFRSVFVFQNSLNLAAFFQNSYFFRPNLLLSSHYLRTGSTIGQVIFGIFRIKKFSEGVIFQTRYIWSPSTFSEELLFGKSYLFKRPYFSSQLFFHNIFFQKR